MAVLEAITTSEPVLVTETYPLSIHYITKKFTPPFSSRYRESDGRLTILGGYDFEAFHRALFSTRDRIKIGPKLFELLIFKNY